MSGSAWRISPSAARQHAPGAPLPAGASAAVKRAHSTGDAAVILDALSDGVAEVGATLDRLDSAGASWE